MGSFNMNASWSKMPLRGNDKVVVIICLKRQIQDEVSYLPLTLPIYGRYLDCGGIDNFSRNEITKAICSFFEYPETRMSGLIDTLFEMSIRGNYKADQRRIKRGDSPLYEAEFKWYTKILDKLRNSSGIKVQSEEEIEEELNHCFGQLSPEQREFAKNLLISRKKDLEKLLETYEISLFYEHQSIWEALTGVPMTDDKGNDYYPYEIKEEVSEYLENSPDGGNLFYITKYCPGTEKLKTDLYKLLMNHKCENKTLKFIEPTYSSQDMCKQMWKNIGQAISNILVDGQD